MKAEEVAWQRGGGKTDGRADRQFDAAFMSVKPKTTRVNW